MGDLFAVANRLVEIRHAKYQS